MVAEVCQHQDTLVTVIETLLVPFCASGIAWVTAKYKTLPPPLQSALQVLALNPLHAIGGEPIPTTKGTP